MYTKTNFDIAKIDKQNIYGLQVYPDKTVAMDGRMIVSISIPEKIMREDVPIINGMDPTREFEPFVISEASAKQISKSIPNKKSDRYICKLSQISVNEEIKFASTDLTTTTIIPVKKEEKRIIDYERAIPIKKPLVIIGISASILKQVCELAETMFECKDNATFKMSLINADTAIKFETENIITGQKMFAMIMPRIIKTIKKEIK